jgi:hypothetical protein
MNQEIKVVAQPKSKEAIFLQTKPACVIRCAAVVPDEIKEAIKAGENDIEKLRNLKTKSTATQTV